MKNLFKTLGISLVAFGMAAAVGVGLKANDLKAAHATDATITFADEDLENATDVDDRAFTFGSSTVTSSKGNAGNAPTAPLAIVFDFMDSYKLGDQFSVTNILVEFEGGAVEEIDSDDTRLTYYVSETSTPDYKSTIAHGDYIHNSLRNKYLTIKFEVPNEDPIYSDTVLMPSIEDAEIKEYVEPTYMYYKVTSLSDIEAGNYLIVWNGYIFNGSDVAKNYERVSMRNGQIKYSSQIAAYSVDLQMMDGGYSICLQSNNPGENAGKFIGGKTNDNGFTFGDEGILNTITYTSCENTGTGLFDLTSNGTKLRFNNNANNNRFRYYKTTTADTASYYGIDLYTKGIYKEPVGTPVDYIMSAIDAFRLNNEVNGNASICNVDTSIYSSDVWTKMKKLYNNLTIDELALLNVKDKFSSTAYTYVQTMEMLLEKEAPSSAQSLSAVILNAVSNNSSSILGIIIVCSLGAVSYIVIKKAKKRA